MDAVPFKIFKKKKKKNSDDDRRIIGQQQHWLVEQVPSSSLSRWRLYRQGAAVGERDRDPCADRNLAARPIAEEERRSTRAT